MLQENLRKAELALARRLSGLMRTSDVGSADVSAQAPAPGSEPLGSGMGSAETENGSAGNGIVGEGKKERDGEESKNDIEGAVANDDNRGKDELDDGASEETDAVVFEI